MKSRENHKDTLLRLVTPFLTVERVLWTKASGTLPWAVFWRYPFKNALRAMRKLHPDYRHLALGSFPRCSYQTRSGWPTIAPVISSCEMNPNTIHQLNAIVTDVITTFILPKCPQ